jgi:hypothetical protein
MTWLGNISSADRWREEPTATAGQAALCLVGFPFCLAYEVGHQSRELAKEAGQVVAQARSRASSIVTDVGDAAATAIESTAEPLEQAANIAMWTAIGIIAMTIAVIAMVALGFKIF